MSRLNEYLESVRESKADKEARWAKQEVEERQRVKGTRTEILKKAIEMYSGKKITKIEIHPDPQVAGTYAIRANGMDFLITRFPLRKTYKDIIDNLEDVEWETWPPKSGDLRFF